MDTGVEYFELEPSAPNVIAMRIHGTLRQGALQGFVERLEQAVAQGQKVRLYVDLVKYSGFDLGLVKEKLANMGAIWSGVERVAYVVDYGWMNKSIALVDAITPMHLRAFSHDAQDEARAWVLADEVEAAQPA